jgi:hypothetical protein
MSILLRLSLIEEPGWDLDHVRQTSNVVYYFEQLVLKFQQAGNSLDQHQRNPSESTISYQTRCWKMLLWVKNLYEAKLASESQELATQQQTETVEVDLLNGQQNNFLDEVDWADMLMGGSNFGSGSLER